MTALRFKKLKTFEFFLWSDLRNQPTFEYIKGRIAKALQVRSSQFHFETISGTKLDYRSVALNEKTSQEGEAMGSQKKKRASMVPRSTWAVLDGVPPLLPGDRALAKVQVTKTITTIT